MRIIFICKFSIEIGFGHLIRSHALALSIYKLHQDIELRFIAIGNNIGEKIVKKIPFNASLIPNEESLVLKEKYDIVFLDMLSATDILFDKINNIPCKVSLSPIFNRFQDIDILFHRTKYIQLETQPKQIFAGLEYSIISDTCIRIPTYQYEHNLESSYFPIAIAMGGGDAANRTLACLKELKKCKIPATFWVMLGEGYSHSYEQLINEIRQNTNHEIILVKSDTNMWRIMRNCILCILPGGITAYEAAYAGMPFIAIENDDKKKVLLKELEQNNVCKVIGSFAELNYSIEHLFDYKKKLFLMHFNSKNLFTNNYSERIIDRCKKELIKKDK